VMGCVVNGPGEAREADIALAGGKDVFVLYVHGELVVTIPQADAVERVVELVKAWQGAVNSAQ